MAVIKSIGELNIPPTLSGNAEIFNSDSIRRTVSMRMIKKISSVQKWRVTLNYEGRAINPEYQHKLYDKINSMRTIPETIIFENPQTGEIVSAKMLYTEAFSPIIVSHDNTNPKFYSNSGAVFEEI